MGAAIAGAIWFGFYIRQYEGKVARNESEISIKTTQLATTPHLSGTISSTHSKIVNKLRQTNQTISLFNDSLVDVEIVSIRTQVSVGIPTDEFQNVLDALNGDDAPMSVVMKPMIDDSNRKYVWNGYSQVPHGQIFSINYPSNSLDWFHLPELDSESLKKETIEPGDQYNFWQKYVLTIFPEIESRRWYNVSFIVEYKDGEESTRKQTFCETFGGKPIPFGFVDSKGNYVECTESTEK